MYLLAFKRSSPRHSYGLTSKHQLYFSAQNWSLKVFLKLHLLWWAPICTTTTTYYQEVSIVETYLGTFPHLSVCTYLCIHIFLFVPIYVSTSFCLYLSMYPHLSVCTCIHLPSPYVGYDVSYYPSHFTLQTNGSLLWQVFLVCKTLIFLDHFVCLLPLLLTMKLAIFLCSIRPCSILMES